jgi:hypothetical protein
MTPAASVEGVVGPHRAKLQRNLFTTTFALLALAGYRAAAVAVRSGEAGIFSGAFAGGPGYDTSVSCCGL